tara:strand:- start:80 stop:547 length:468 start_codon:yes stop_codon:yes gene_type:complete
MSHRYRYYKAYFRFQNVVVPQGATIDSAYIKLNWEGGEEVDFLIAAVDVDDFDVPTDNTYAAHGTETTATVSWNIPSEGSQDSGKYYKTSPDIKTIIQEIVDRTGWSSGNAIGIIVREPVASRTSDEYRTVHGVTSTTDASDGTRNTNQLVITHS